MKKKTKENNLRVLNVTVLLDPVIGGGTAERTYQMSKALSSGCCSVVILTNAIGQNIDRISHMENVLIIALPVIIKRFPLVCFSWGKIKRLIKNVDVIHLMGHWNMLNVIVYLMAKQFGVPYIVCPAGELPIFGRSGLIKRLFNVLIGRRIVRDAAGHVAITPDEFAAFEKYGIERNRVTLIPNGINEEDFQISPNESFSKQLGLNGASFILFMGRLNPIKGPDLLLDAFCNICEHFPQYHLVFAGPDGGMLKQLKQIVDLHNIQERVHFVGYISGQDKTDAYRAADFLVIPSRQEAMSIVVLEAGINKTPVLLTDCCGFNEVDAIGGGVVVHATVEDLEKGLLKLLGNKALTEMGELLHAFVRRNYTWSLISKLYRDLFWKVSS